MSAKMSRPERRGAKLLEGPVRPAKGPKRPVTWYVHYQSQGGELLAFACEGTPGLGPRLEGSCRVNVCPYSVSMKLAPKARLIVLPSQTALGMPVSAWHIQGDLQI